MNTNNPSSDESLRSELLRLGAREFEVVALSMDPVRGLAALAVATSRGVDHPISYAIKVFDNPDWHPSGEARRVATNVHADVRCATCGGDRFVFVTDNPHVLYGETVKPCPSCNTSLDAGFWKANGERFVVAK